LSRDGPVERSELRVLLVTFDPPENIGGIEGRVEGYVKELSKRGVKVEIVSLAPGYKTRIGVSSGARAYEMSSSSVKAVGSLLATERILTREKLSSVFLLSGALTLYGNILLAECRFMRRRTAILFYGKDILQIRRSFLGRMLILSSILLSRTVFANSRFTASLLPPIAHRKLRLLYPSVNPELGLMGAPDNLSAKHILFVGRLVKRKGADDLIDAFASISKEFPDWRLEIIGDGPERKDLERLVADLNLGGRVDFLGALRGRALYERYRVCDVVAMPSKRLADDVEGFGTVFLEAGIFGKPSLGTFSGGIPESIVNNETGLLVPEGDTGKLTKAMERLLAAPQLRREMGRKARDRVLSGFTWRHSAERLLKALSGA